MRKKEEIQGGEFDWFAIDTDGNYALFATAGEGFVPDPPLSLADSFDAISDSVDTPNWGSVNVWDDYAALGLYVFDWKLHGGPYVRVRCPADTRLGDLIDRLGGIDNIPKFHGAFEETPSVEEWSNL